MGSGWEEEASEAGYTQNQGRLAMLHAKRHDEQLPICTVRFHFVMHIS